MRVLCIFGNSSSGREPPAEAAAGAGFDLAVEAAFFGLFGLGREACWALGFLGRLLIRTFQVQDG
jgi:hypothetical protein